MSDPRFARLKTDPRFRRIRKNASKVTIDERFKGIFDRDKKNPKGRVDKYGRAISDNHEQENLRRFYRLENEDESVPRDFARGEVLLESSDEEDQQPSENNSTSDDEDLVTIGSRQSKPITLAEEQDINLDENDFADLDAQAKAYAEANNDNEAVPAIAPTKRLAVVNLDWDHVKASHLYKIFSSLVSSFSGEGRKGRGDSSNSVVRGRVLSVRIYPSDFGRERLAREEKEGPPPEIFKRSKEIVNEDEINERTVYEVGDEDEFDEDALRKYQLERLRYYYAIVVCDTVDTASHIYSELEGAELERSANVFDMSFVPEDMTFEQDFRDEATENSNTQFKPLDFTTDALRHSKVKLTWDQDDPERNRFTRRTLSRKEIEEDDFKAYIASSSSEAEDSAPQPHNQKSKKSSERDKLRELLLGGSTGDLPEGWGNFDEKRQEDDLDMEISFTPGLSEVKDDMQETTLEKYQRKMKEKRKKRKEVLMEKSKSQNADGKRKLEDDFLDDGSSESSDRSEAPRPQKPKNKKEHDRIAIDASRPKATPEELALLLASDNPKGAIKHFDMSAVLKSEKKGRRKSKGKKAEQKEEDNELQEGFVIDVNDARFKAIHDDPTFALDPSNPHFKRTKSMTALLEERSKRQKVKQENKMSTTGNATTIDRKQKNLQSLVESVKRKSTAADGQGMGKRKKT